MTGKVIIKVNWSQEVENRFGHTVQVREIVEFKQVRKKKERKEKKRKIKSKKS